MAPCTVLLPCTVLRSGTAVALVQGGPVNFFVLEKAFRSSGGEGGIRTLDTLAGIHVLQTCALDHYATSPR
ncbi:MAG: hypothetical protein XD98_0055 [Microgenomates bacterium 39_6]|nr:MAG: hypothetical protein XD98_0055 [Microgenomates bacterium 39_6]